MASIDDLAGFPRPDRTRPETVTLDGDWSLEYDLRNEGLSSRWFNNPRFSRTIRVPFCIESEASGIADPNPPRVVWYSREFVRGDAPAGDRILLNFGAVDYRADVWLNGKYLGSHEGCYTPFTFDITGALDDSNLLAVRVEDAKSAHQPRGKQTLLKKPFLIFYPGVTGIWQPVWLEGCGRSYLQAYRAFADATGGKLEIRCRIAGDELPASVAVNLESPAGEITAREASLDAGSPGRDVTLRFEPGVENLWSVDRPNLYGLQIVTSAASSTDEVRGYVGLRDIRVRGSEVLLNGEPLYQKLVLCQGYFPGGHYSPLEAAQFKRDVELVRSMGFNGIRMHQKVEDPRLLFWCDRLGCLVWEEMPSAYRHGAAMKAALEAQWAEVMERDFNHPSIVARVPLNESWGVGLFPFPFNVRKKTREYVKRLSMLTKELDPTRPVVDNSGYEHTGAADIIDIHHYLSNASRCRKLYDELEFPQNLKWSALRILKGAVPGRSNQNAFARGESYAGQPLLISEYGGFGFYGSSEEKTLLEGFAEYTALIRERKNLRGYCYTQLYDTFQEKNGLLDFDRKPKADPNGIRAVND